MFRKNKVKEIIYDSLLLALLIVASKISIPVFAIPFTLQILIVLIICLTVKVRDSLIIILIYIILGLIGIPVFATAIAGIGYIIVPSFGFIIGYIFMALLIEPLKKLSLKLFSRESYIMISLIVVLVDYVIGFIYALFLVKWLKVVDIDMTILKMLFNFIIVFIPFDIIKCILASIIAKRINNSTSIN